LPANARNTNLIVEDAHFAGVSDVSLAFFGLKDRIRYTATVKFKSDKRVAFKVVKNVTKFAKHRDRDENLVEEVVRGRAIFEAL
jgi:hypothetical protein